jgi:hypothetical protein
VNSHRDATRRRLASTTDLRARRRTRRWTYTHIGRIQLWIRKYLAVQRRASVEIDDPCSGARDVLGVQVLSIRRTQRRWGSGPASSTLVKHTREPRALSCMKKRDCVQQRTIIFSVSTASPLRPAMVPFVCTCHNATCAARPPPQPTPITRRLQNEPYNLC